MSQAVKENIEALCKELEDFISTKTVVGEAITVGDVVLLPLIGVAFGMGVGGSDGKDGKNTNGAGGMGAKITPSAVLAVVNGSVQLINIKNQDAVSKLIDMAPGVVNKLNFGSLFGQKKETPDVKFEETIITKETDAKE